MIEVFIEQYCNRFRLHSALGYRTPEEFEQEAFPGINTAGATMSFFRHEEIYQSDVEGSSSGERPKSLSLANCYEGADFTGNRAAKVSGVSLSDATGGSETIGAAKHAAMEKHRTPPGPSRRARTAMKWIKRTAKWRIAES